MPDANGESTDPSEIIIQAAHMCFEKWGVRRTRMDDIADAAGIARPNLYRHFSGKDAIIKAVVYRQTEMNDELRTNKIKLKGPVAALLIEAMVLGTDLSINDPFLRDLHDDETEILKQEMLVSDSHLLELRGKFWYPIIEYGRSRGEIRPDITNEVLIRWLAYMSYNFVDRRTLFPTDETVRFYVSTFVVPSLLTAKAYAALDKTR